MKHTYIFFTWLLADLFLSLIYILYSLFTIDFSDLDIFLIAIPLGFVMSIPSLIVLEVAVFDYNKKDSAVSFKKYFSEKIILINIFYFLCSCLFFSSKSFFLPSSETLFYGVLFYSITLLAGLASLWIVNKKIK